MASNQDTNKNALVETIRQHALLPEDVKSRMESVVETLSPEKTEGLLAMLTSGTEATIATMVKDVVKADPSATPKIDEFFRQADKYLRATREHVEHGAEEAGAESLLNAA